MGKNMQRINEQTFSEVIAKGNVTEMTVKIDGDKKLYTFYHGDEALGQKTLQGERVRYYLPEDVVKALPEDSRKKHAHKGKRKAAKKTTQEVK